MHKKRKFQSPTVSNAARALDVANLRAASATTWKHAADLAAAAKSARPPTRPLRVRSAASTIKASLFGDCSRHFGTNKFVATAICVMRRRSCRLDSHADDYEEKRRPAAAENSPPPLMRTATRRGGVLSATAAVARAAAAATASALLFCILAFLLAVQPICSSRRRTQRGRDAAADRRRPKFALRKIVAVAAVGREWRRCAARFRFALRRSLQRSSSLAGSRAAPPLGYARRDRAARALNTQRSARRHRRLPAISRRASCGLIDVKRRRRWRRRPERLKPASGELGDNKQRKTRCRRARARAAPSLATATKELAFAFSAPTKRANIFMFARQPPLMQIGSLICLLIFRLFSSVAARAN